MTSSRRPTNDLFRAATAAPKSAKRRRPDATGGEELRTSGKRLSWTSADTDGTVRRKRHRQDESGGDRVLAAEIPPPQAYRTIWKVAKKPMRRNAAWPTARIQPERQIPCAASKNDETGEPRRTSQGGATAPAR